MLNSSRPTPGGDWLADCAAALAERLQGPAFAAFVLDAPDGPGLASCAVATFTPRLPGPHSSAPHVGEIHSVATDERWRRRGYAGAVVTAAMQWLSRQGCSSVRLTTSPDGESLYTGLGFRVIPTPLMTWQCGPLPDQGIAAPAQNTRDVLSPAVRTPRRSIAHVMVLLQRPADGRVLTIRHQATSWHSPDLLTVVGGRLEADEDLDAGAARELYEETGISVPPEQLEFRQLVHMHAADGERVIGSVFTARTWEGEPYNREPDTHSELVWVDPHTPPPDCHPFTHQVLHLFSTGRTYANLVPEQAASPSAPTT
ncbi:bifunctional GNAT family N-acetyltransferase/NUDIX hydrolase [Streptomyces sp. NBC_01601]|uniref:bifunctional GNAT family N-acetyltransferase/NUDIX hydrolase n=1 Tax=Streptomyces sp. NBC_01601 TaxID=2975892 RepID=UPI002E28BE73|nr:bifunctional GNAT family N-acetyltransferase/NUDIX hydrolase [Streptomyces sp. NBC_01601]